MKRFHALEWEDLSWFPSSWRDFGTDYLSFVARKFDIYKVILPVLEKGLKASKNEKWIDCASGGGSAILTLIEPLKEKFPNLKVKLSDFYPNIKTFQRIKEESQHEIDFEINSIDATNIPELHQGKFRTMFASFHHFRPKQALAILQNAVDTNSPIAIFEPVGRNFFSFFSMLFVILNVLIFTPFIRPFRLSVLPFIYIIPLIPLYILWDGLASIFRNYSVKEMEDLVSNLSNKEKFVWEIGVKKNKGIPTYFLLGIPKKI
ncbi:MAG: hypothetical protein V4622_07470 [Bacteroidota bacterium]